MKLIMLLCMTICAVNISPGQTSHRPTDKTLAQLKTYREAYCKTFRDKNPEQLNMYYANSIRLMPAFQKTIIGRQNAIAYLTAFQNRFTVLEISRNEIEILDLGDQVMETGTFTLRMTQESNTKEYRVQGKYLDLWKESKDGSLLLITDAWNYDSYYADLHENLRFDEIMSIHAATLPNVHVNSSIRFELAALNRLLDVTVTQHDGDTWSLYYTNDSMLLTSYFPVLKGKRAIDEYLQRHVKELPVFEELDIRNDRVDNLGMFVVEYASHIASWKNGSSSGVSMGKNIRVWRREADHSLKIFRAIGMYD